MAEYRLSQVARKLNVGKNTILEFLKDKGHKVDSNPNSKIPQDQYDMLAREFADSAHDKEEASELTIGGKTDNLVIDAEKGVTEHKKEDERILIKDNVASEVQPEKISARTKLDGPKVVGKIDLGKKKKEELNTEQVKEEETKSEVVQENVVETPPETVVEKKEAPVEPEKKAEEETPKPAPVDKKEQPKKEPEEPKKEVIKAKAAHHSEVEEGTIIVGLGLRRVEKQKNFPIRKFRIKSRPPWRNYLVEAEKEDHKDLNTGRINVQQKLKLRKRDSFKLKKHQKH